MTDLNAEGQIATRFTRCFFRALPLVTPYRIQEHRSSWLFWLRRWQAEVDHDPQWGTVRAHTRRGIEQKARALRDRAVAALDTNG